MCLMKQQCSSIGKPEQWAKCGDCPDSTLSEPQAASTGLLRGEEYNFKNQPERLKYIGKVAGWHQFEKIGEQGVWCELLDEDLHMIEKRQPRNPVLCGSCVAVIRPTMTC